MKFCTKTVITIIGRGLWETIFNLIHFSMSSNCTFPQFAPVLTGQVNFTLLMMPKIWKCIYFSQIFTLKVSNFQNRISLFAGLRAGAGMVWPLAVHGSSIWLASADIQCTRQELPPHRCYSDSFDLKLLWLRRYYIIADF